MNPGFSKFISSPPYKAGFLLITFGKSKKKTKKYVNLETHFSYVYFHIWHACEYKVLARYTVNKLQIYH